MIAIAKICKCNVFTKLFLSSIVIFYVRIAWSKTTISVKHNIDVREIKIVLLERLLTMFLTDLLWFRLTR